MIEEKNQKAWVVFTGQTDLPWLKILRPGFRHCFVLLHDGAHWITLDPLSNYTDVSVHHVPEDFNLPEWLRGRGHRVIETTLHRVQKPAPFMLFTCVEAVKRVLGLHKRFIFTPWQLYRHLEKCHPRALRSFCEAGLNSGDPGKPDAQRLTNSFKGELSWEA